jgi:hypothetical protein
VFAVFKPFTRACSCCQPDAEGVSQLHFLDPTSIKRHIICSATSTKMAAITSKMVLDHYSSIAREYNASNAEHIKKVAESFGYAPEDLAGIPDGANLGVSCGNPLAIASIKSVCPASYYLFWFHIQLRKLNSTERVLNKLLLT